MSWEFPFCAKFFKIHDWIEPLITEKKASHRFLAFQIMTKILHEIIYLSDFQEMPVT